MKGLLAVLLCTSLAGCMGPTSHPPSPQGIECGRIATDLSVLFDAIVKHMEMEGSTSIEVFDSKQPPDWLSNLANGKLELPGIGPEDVGKVQQALGRNTRYVVAAEAVGKGLREELDRSSPILVAEDAPTYCSLYGVTAAGRYLEREPVDEPVHQRTNTFMCNLETFIWQDKAWFEGVLIHEMYHLHNQVAPGRESAAGVIAGVGYRVAQGAWEVPAWRRQLQYFYDSARIAGKGSAYDGYKLGASRAEGELKGTYGAGGR